MSLTALNCAATDQFTVASGSTSTLVDANPKLSSAALARSAGSFGTETGISPACVGGAVEACTPVEVDGGCGVAIDSMCTLLLVQPAGATRPERS